MKPVAKAVAGISGGVIALLALLAAWAFRTETAPLPELTGSLRRGAIVSGGKVGKLGGPNFSLARRVASCGLAVGIDEPSGDADIWIIDLARTGSFVFLGRRVRCQARRAAGA